MTEMNWKLKRDWQKVILKTTLELHLSIFLVLCHKEQQRKKAGVITQRNIVAIFSRGGFEP
jgi:hypothetical protein